LLNSFSTYSLEMLRHSRRNITPWRIIPLILSKKKQIHVILLRKLKTTKILDSETFFFRHSYVYKKVTDLRIELSLMYKGRLAVCGLTIEPNRDIGILTMKRQQLFQIHLMSPGDVVITASSTTVIVLSGIVAI